MTAHVSSRSGASMSNVLAPLGICRLRQVRSRGDAHQAFERPEQRMTPGSGLLARLAWRILETSHRALPSVDTAENQLAGFDIDLLGDEARLEPNLGHHIVPGIIAPPRAMMLRGRQLSPDDPFDLRERHRDFGRALLA